MKKNLFLISLFAFVSCSQATLLVYEPFAVYSSGNIIGQNPNVTGFSGAWNGSSPNNVQATGGSLVRSNIPGPYYLAPNQGGKIVLNGTTANPIVSRNLNISTTFSPYSTDGLKINKGKIFLSFLMSADSLSQIGSTDSYSFLKIGTLGIGLFKNINYAAGTSGVFGVDVGGDYKADYILPNIRPETGITLTHTQWTRGFIAEFDLKTGNDTISFWLDPISASESASPDLVISSLDVSFSALDLITNYGSSFDEIIFGTTFQDVLVIPEPSSLSLLALGGVVVALRRRR